MTSSLTATTRQRRATRRQLNTTTYALDVASKRCADATIDGVLSREMLSVAVRQFREEFDGQLSE